MIERYSTDAMKEIWSEENKYKAWLEVEILSSEAFSELGVISKAEVKAMRENAKLDIQDIYEIEKETRHDVVAFTRSVSKSLGEEKKWVHYGLTSTDVVDTAYGYLYLQANTIIEEKLLEFIEVLKSKAIEHKYTVQMGRTHGVHAELTTFGLKMALYYEEMKRNLTRFQEARKIIEVGKISGAVGTYANVNPFIQDYVCEKLKIDSARISTQTLQRDRHAQYITTLAIIATTLEKIAVELRHLQRTELREVMEGFKKGQKGSSAMPHKKNPISSENITGLARIIKGYVIPALEDNPLWHERDISHSSVERIMMPDATNLTHYMLNRMLNVLNDLYVDKERMEKNIGSTKNVFFSQKVMLTLIEKGYSREEAYDLVQPIAISSFENDEDFKVNIRSKLLDILTEEEFENCFSKTYHFEQVDYIFNRLGLD